jgi:hypothetical protein
MKRGIVGFSFSVVSTRKLNKGWTLPERDPVLSKIGSAFCLMAVYIVQGD